MKYHSNKGLKKRCGCKRRTWETCAHPWFFNFTYEKVQYRGALDVSTREEAVKKFDEIKVAIRNGTFVKAHPEPMPVVDERPTFVAVASHYLKQYIEQKLAAGAASHHRSIVNFLAGILVPPGIAFTEKPFRLITQEDVEMALAAKRQRTATIVTKGDKTWTRTTGGDVAANRMHGHLSALWNWAIQPKRAYADKTPFSYGGRVPDELKKPKEHGRDRRLHPGEEEGLLASAGPHLRDCIVAALEAGLRRGEILSLQWKHVRWLQNELLVEWRNTKTKRTREIPISPALRELLVRRQKAHPKDQAWKPDHYVFGNEVGDRVKDIRTAWDNAVLKAHGVKVARGHGGRVSAENRTRLHQIDLNFHDLRHEAGSRKLEAGWPLHAVSRWLGHTKLTTTDTYLNATTRLLHELNERKPLTLVRN